MRPPGLDGRNVQLKIRFNSALRREFAPGDRRRWFLWSVALRVDLRAVSIWTFEVYWRRLLLGSLAVMMAGYLGATTALFFWLGRNPQNQVGWTDILLAPARWEQFRERRGDTAIATALVRLKERDYVEGFHGLRVGLARSPGNVDGRTTLAGLYSGHDPAQALKVLEAGLDVSANDPEFLRVLLGFYSIHQAQNRAIEVITALLAPARQPALHGEARRVLEAGRATLLIEKGRADEVLSLLPSIPADAPDAGRVAHLRISALLRLGRTAGAQAEFAQLPIQRNPTMENSRIEAELAIAAENATALEGALRRMRAVAPLEPQASLYSFQAWHRLRRLTLRDAVEGEFYRAFGTNDSALQMLAAVAVNLDLPEVVNRAMQVAQRSRLSQFAFRVHLTELALRRGEFDQAFRQAREWERGIGTLSPAQRGYPEFISRLARATVVGGTDEGAGLLAYLGTMRGRATPAMFELTSNVMERAGNAGAAREVLKLGRRLYPYSDVLIGREDRLMAQGAARTAEATALATAAKAETDRLAQAALPATGPLALQELDRLLADEAYLGARDLLQLIRANNPAWQEMVESELAVREVELALLTRDLFASRALVRAHLDRYRTDAAAVRLVRIAAGLLARERSAEARIVHDEVAATRSSAAVAFALQGLNLTDDLAVYAASAEAALAALDRSLSQRQPAEALRVFDYLRQKAPPWHAGARNEPAVREVKIRLALDQRPLAFAALKDLVVRSGVPRAAAFKLVRDLIAAGEADTAVLLAREIVKLLPGDVAGAKLLKEAETPRSGN